MISAGTRGHLSVSVRRSAAIRAATPSCPLRIPARPPIPDARYTPRREIVDPAASTHRRQASLRVSSATTCSTTAAPRNHTGAPSSASRKTSRRPASTATSAPAATTGSVTAAVRRHGSRRRGAAGAAMAVIAALPSPASTRAADVPHRRGGRHARARRRRGSLVAAAHRRLAGRRRRSAGPTPTHRVAAALLGGPWTSPRFERFEARWRQCRPTSGGLRTHSVPQRAAAQPAVGASDVLMKRAHAAEVLVWTIGRRRTPWHPCAVTRARSGGSARPLWPWAARTRWSSSSVR